jgi:putative phage-type endonuclease
MTSETDAAFRLAHIGASEASALVGLSPYETPWSLYQQKIGAIPPADFSQLGERQRWGLALERAILNEFKDRTGADARKWMGNPLSNGVLGCHPDGRVVVSNKTRAMVEIKTTDWLVWKAGGEEPPEHQIIQLQVQMGLAGVNLGHLLVLIGGNDLKIFDYEFRPKLFDIIQLRGIEFWDRVQRKDPPPVNFEKDAEAIKEVFRTGGGPVKDMSGSNSFVNACEEYLRGHAIEKEGKEIKDAAGAELKYLADTSDELVGQGWALKFTNVAGKPETVITADMVGQTIKGSAPQRRINQPKKIGAKA